jgi:adenosylcobinamide-GDP ribazoletransferase
MIWHDFLGALSLLTTIPAGKITASDQPGRIYAYFPLVGVVIGGLLALVASIEFLPNAMVAFLTVSAWVLLTGGLHLDGVGDAADGLLATVEPARRLEIMKDSRAGSWAVIALILLLLGKFVAVQTVPPLLLIAPPVVGRWVAALASWAYPYARREGIGGYFRQGLGRPQIITATVLMLLAVGVLALIGHPVALLAPLIGLALLVGGGRWAAGRLGGGLTGDVYGALCEITELACLVALSVRIG